MLMPIAKRAISTIKKIKKSELQKRVDDLNRFVGYPKQVARNSKQMPNPNRLRITWIIPDFIPGAGGHMTIFRMASHLERFGHDVNILIQNPTEHETGAAAKKTINDHFQPFDGCVSLFDTAPPQIEGDALIATDRFTCYPAEAMSGFCRKFYFVQDYETLFYPAGPEYLLTESTYHFDFDCLCAGEWLHQLMSRKYGRWSVSWPLAYDANVYHDHRATERSKNRVAFYARYVTPRRAVEIGLMALDILHRNCPGFHVDFFGWNTGKLDVNYEYTNHGIMKPSQLADLYRSSTVGVVFSVTNHSLVNKEMMACGLPVVDLDLENVRAIFPRETMEFANPNPAGIAAAISNLLNDSALRSARKAAGLSFIDGLSWEKSARVVENAIRERIMNWEKIEVRE